MSELKRYDVYKSSQSYFIDGCPMYKCSDVDTKLDEIAKLKEMLKVAAGDCDETRYLISQANYIGAFKLIQEISDKLREAAEK